MPEAMSTASQLRQEMLPVLQRLPAYSRLAWRLLRDSRVRRPYRDLLLGGLGYLLSPIDLVPGFIPGVGQLDDLAIVLLSLKGTLKAAPHAVAAQHLADVGLTWDVLDEDLARVGRSARLLGRAALALGRRAIGALRARVVTIARPAK